MKKLSKIIKKYMTLIQHIYQKEEMEHCLHNRNIFSRLKEEFDDLQVKEITNKSPEGRKLVKQFDISILPATIVGGKFYRSGGVDEQELKEMLRHRNS